MAKTPTKPQKNFAFRSAAPSKRMVPKPPETKRERFERMALPRVNRALDSIRLIGNLSGPVYEHTQADLDQIKEALIEAIGEAMERFEKPVREKRTFELKHHH